MRSRLDLGLISPEYRRERPEGLLATRGHRDAISAVSRSFETEDEVLAAANDTEYGLAAYFYTQARIRRMAMRNSPNDYS